MKTYPVAPFRLLIALVAPSAILIICTFLLTSLTNAQTTHPSNIIAVEFIKRDQLLVDVGDDGFVNPGDIVQYTVSLSNTSNIALANLQITDTIDPNTTLLGGTLVVSPLAFADEETAVTNTPLTIPAPGLLANDDLQGPGTTIATHDTTTAHGGSVVLQPDGGFSYQPPANFVGSDNFSYTLTNDAGSDTAVVHINVVNSDLAVGKSVNNPTPFAGDSIAYTVRITNEGAIPLSNILISDTLPTGLTYDNHNASAGSSFNPVTGLWEVPTLAVGDNATLTINMTINAGTAGQTITNTAVIQSLDQPDANTANNSASATITIHEEPTTVDIALSKSVNNSTPFAGDTIVYTITAANLGPDNATGVEITDALPNGVTFVTSDQASYVPPIWTIGSLNANQTATLNITATVNNIAAGSVIKNTATVTAVNEADTNPNNNSASATITVQETVTDVDIALSKTVNNPTPVENDTIVYTITATNNGPDAATGIQVTDLLPTGVTHLNSNTNRGSYTPANGIWSIGSVNANQTATLNITATVDSDTAVQTITNIVTLTAVNEPDSNPGNNSASATITVHETVTDVDIALSKTVDDSTPLADDTIVYTITAANLGSDDATGVEITDALPNGVTFVTSDQASYVPPIWTIGNLNANQTAVLHITATVNGGTAGSAYTNIAALTAVSQTDTNPTNNSGSATITIHQAPTAVDDDPGNTPAYQVTTGTMLNQPNGANDPVERNDDVGFPTATIASFGGGTLGGTVTNHNAGSTVAPLPTFTDGSLTVYGNGRFTFTPPTDYTGNFQFRYRLSNSVGTSDATITVHVQEDPDQESPDAVDDPTGSLPANSTPGSTPYHLHAGSSNNAISDLLNNDTLGNPAAALTHFGGGSLGDSVTDHTAGQTATNDGHTLRVNSNGSLTYTPSATFTGLFTFQYRLTNPAGTDDATVTIAVGERPSCSNDSYSATGNIAISHEISTGVLANDADDGVVTAVQNSTVGTPQSSNQNGQITVQADGSFVYDPPPGFNGQDSFTYTINNGFDDPQTCTTTVSVSDRVWFIDSSASGSNLGTLSHPFTTVAAFNSANGSGALAPAVGDLIYLLQGSGYNESDGINLLNNQRLIGQGINLATVINTNATFNLPPSGPAHTPLLQTTGGSGVDLSANNTIRGLDIGNTPAGFALEGTAVGNPIINEVNITGTGGALRIDGGTFGNNVSFDTLESTASPAQNVQLTNVTGNLNVNSGGSGLSGAADTAVAISGGTINFNYPGSITQNANFATVSVSEGHSGDLTFSGSIHATNGTGLQFANADGSYTFNGTTMLNGGDAGIDILTGSNGTFTFNNAAITNPSGTSFNLMSSTANVIYSGSIDDVDDTAVVISNNDNSTVTFNSGSITSGFGGMTIINSNNSVITIENSIDFDTASDDALVLRNNDDSTINFTGQIDINTTTGAAFLADGGGAVSATGSSSVLNTTNRGTAVIISNTTTIGSNNITFHTINTNEASSGIILDDTGELGALIVSNGGTINNSTGDGISILNGNISLNQMNILNSGGHGISAQLDGNTNMHVQLTNNTISGSDVEGIFVDVGGNGRMDLILDNNIVNTPLNADGTRIQSQSQTTLCANISDNQSSGSSGMADFHLIQQFPSAFYLEDFATDVQTTLVNKGNSKTGGGTPIITPEGDEPFAGAMECNSAPTELNGNNKTINDLLSWTSPTTQIPCTSPPLPCTSAPYPPNQINHTIKTLPPGKTVTLRFNVQINTPFPAGSEQISSQAVATAVDLPAMYSDDPDTAVRHDPTITPIATIKLAYLPLILHNVTTLPDWPDLVVESIATTHDNLTVILKNSGTAPVTNEFWVDAYFSPNPPPTNVNQTIQTLGVDGIVWGVDNTALPIAPGETLTLTLNSPYYNAQHSRFSGTIPAGDLYVQVDSANTATTYGAVLEVHEAAGGAYNNIAATTARRSVIIAVNNTQEQSPINNSLGKRP